mmetsp:Transcript_24047/g.71559  ORF Transcript_24047/g.71559 Transcript_24047/m.71559 type:complete len:200 (+) Transcript_24047:891-1490(+)
MAAAAALHPPEHEAGGRARVDRYDHAAVVGAGARVAVARRSRGAVESRRPAEPAAKGARPQPGAAAESTVASSGVATARRAARLQPAPELVGPAVGGPELRHPSLPPAAHVHEAHGADAPEEPAAEARPMCRAVGDHQRLIPRVALEGILLRLPAPRRGQALGVADVAEGTSGLRPGVREFHGRPAVGEEELLAGDGLR